MNCLPNSGVGGEAVSESERLMIDEIESLRADNARLREALPILESLDAFLTRNPYPALSPGMDWLMLHYRICAALASAHPGDREPSTATPERS